VNIVIEVPDSLVAEVRDAVDKGRYKDAEDFMKTAIENQLERDEGEGQNLMTLDEAIDALNHSADRGEVTDEQAPGSIGDGGSQTPQVGGAAETTSSSEKSLTDRRSSTNVGPVDPPDTRRLDEGPLWGQYNRIFPVKLVVRVLTNELQASDEAAPDRQWIGLPAFEKTVAEVARSIGQQIATYDERRGRTRGAALAVGLPTGDDPDKSRNRFQTHFVGRVEHGGDLTGAPPHLLFVDIQPDDPDRIGLTEAGRDFAAMSNPLLDEGFDADTALSAQESEFYLEHVRHTRPAEYEAMEKIAQAIREGDDRPDSLTERVAYLNPGWSSSQAKTIRSGLTSRMYELGLVDRRQVGQRGIGYELTSDGDALLDR